MNYPLVTVLTLIYNTPPEYLIEGIKSVQRNNYPNVEHIFIDDCSPDPGPKTVLKKWISDNNYKCRFIEHEVNQGVSRNLNEIISIANGKYLMGCCDDVLADDRIFKDVELFETLSDEYAIVFGFSQSIDAQSRLLPKMSPNIPVVESENYFNELAIMGNFISGPAVTMRKDALKAIGGYDENLIVEDYDMWMRLSDAGYKFKVRPAVLIYYRELKGSLSSHPRIPIDLLRIKAKFGNKVPLKSAFDQQLLALLKQGPDQSVKEVMNFYTECFKSYLFARLLKLAHFRAPRRMLLNAKLQAGSLVMKLRNKTT